MAWLQEIFLYSELELHSVSLLEELKNKKEYIFSFKENISKVCEQNVNVKLSSELRKHRRGLYSALLTFQHLISTRVNAILFSMLFSLQIFWQQLVIKWLVEATAWPSCCRSFFVQSNHWFYNHSSSGNECAYESKTALSIDVTFIYCKKQWPFTDKQNVSSQQSGTCSMQPVHRPQWGAKTLATGDRRFHWGLVTGLGIGHYSSVQ